MKNIVKLIGTVAIAFFIMTTPAQSFAQDSNTAVNDSVTINNYSKTITNYLVVYPGHYVVPPATYDYDFGGWKGTLRVTSWAHTGDHLLAYYSGTVHCSGPCVMQQ